jgi:hypothetical protein
MFDVYARSFFEATRFTPNTRPGPRVQEPQNKLMILCKRYTPVWRKG